jgi:hypothetical protein
MRQTREILRTKWELGFSNRKAARSAGVSPATVDNVLKRARSAGLADWRAVASLGEAELSARLYAGADAQESYPRVEP